MTASPYDTDLARNAANFQPLTPLTLLERAAGVHPDHIAIVHGAASHAATAISMPARGGSHRR